ncbi:MAG: type II toxin-antitoxin system VapC family toxin [Tepidisphaeraceae bacterium]|jgi:tRNA(fMet)-specific endonuclease VapC
MLDTTVCVDMLRRPARPNLQRFKRLNLDQLCLSAITFAELVYGVWRSSDPVRNERAVLDFCAALEVAPFDDRAAEVYGQVRSQLEQAGQPIGPLDTLIASHALALNVTLATSNEKEFRRVANLRVENWRTS